MPLMVYAVLYGCIVYRRIAWLANEGNLCAAAPRKPN